MNKNKLTAIKNKIKANGPEIAIGAVSVITITALAVLIKKTAYDNESLRVLNEKTRTLIDETKAAIIEAESFRLEEMTGAARDALLSDDRFSLLKLTDDEYMFCKNPD
jgi:hypothetical protein